MTQTVETISKNTPALSSMQYATLRQMALDRIQKLAGNIWTDYNYHDPGVTLMELLCYVTTDLGYRLTFDIQDLLAKAPGDDTDYKNFYTARQILHNAPINFRDFRKLLMDVSVTVNGPEFEEELGIKNAWLMVSETAEVQLFTDTINKKLSYDQTDVNDPGFYVKGLYNILLEFDNSTQFGDLNSEEMKGTFLLSGLSDHELNGVEVQITINFPGWDEPGVDWENNADILSKVSELIIDFDEVPEGYTLEEANPDDTLVQIKGTKMVSSNPVVLPDLAAITTQINAFIADNSNSLLSQYKQKVSIQKSIVKTALCRLHDNRPLCEDYYKLKALKVEKIAVCGDIVLDGLADPTEVAAAIYYNIANFLSPKVYFYSLEEMQAKNAPGESRLLSNDEIFNGPALQHGFVDDAELDNSDQTCNIRASDLIQLIMDTEVNGSKPVKAVRGLQLANFPEDNDGSIVEKIVKWCLELAIDKFYVPRLSVEESNFTFYKENLPFSVDSDEVNEKIDALTAAERKRYPGNPVLDISILKGSWREVTDYTSIQEDLPMTYGVGSAGIPNLPSDFEARTERIALAAQLKEFLSFFDQLFYNYLQQLDGMKSLFSLNEGTNEWGDLLMNKTYFTKPLVGKRANEFNANPADDEADDVMNIFVQPDIVPEASSLHIFTSKYDALDHKIGEIAETEDAFISRKNRFLDHLLARFCEQFSDYALLQYSMEGAKAGKELISDKLAFLNAYPRISAFRGTAFNYTKTLPWHIHNASGFEDRCALLMGMDMVEAKKLLFSKNFKITETAGKWNFALQIGSKLLVNITPCDTKVELLELIENVVSAGVLASNYSLKETAAGKYKVLLNSVNCGVKPIAQSFKTDLTLIQAKDVIAKSLKGLKAELIEHFTANRKNLTPPLFDYFKIVSHTIDATTTPHLHTVEYILYDRPTYLTGEIQLLTGTVEGPEIEGKNADETKKLTAYNILWKVVRYASDADCYRFNPATAVNYPASYHFEIFDEYGTVLGSDKKHNYNYHLAQIIKNANASAITVQNSATNNGTYTVDTAVADGPYIRIHVNENIPSHIADGNAVFNQSLQCTVDADKRKLTIAGEDLTAALKSGDSIDIYSGSEFVQSVEIRQIYFNTDTVIISNQALEKNTSAIIKYSKTFEIKQITGHVFVVKGGMELLAIEGMVDFMQDKFIQKEGIHLIEHVLLRPKVKNQDTFFEIKTDDDCEDCKISDVYSFTMTVILPYWPDRFLDLNFRAMIEKTIRREAPAHLALNICWVSPIDMMQFETAYKEWLIAINTFKEDSAERITALTNFIEIIMKMRTVYPSGRLHDCNESTVTKNPIILNLTQLGTF